MIALEPAKTPAAKRRDRFYRSRFFAVFRRRKPTFSDGFIWCISTAECATVRPRFDGGKFYNPTAFYDIFRRRYFLYFDGRTRHFPTAVFSIFRRHISCFFNIKRGGVSYHETPPRKSRSFLGISFAITNYRKGVFFAISRDRSGAVRQVQQPSRSQKIIKKYALFGAKHFCGWETDRIAARLGKANARSCTWRTTSGVAEQ